MHWSRFLKVMWWLENLFRKKGGGVKMAGDCNKFSFVDPGHIFGRNLMKLGKGPLFDVLYLQKWSNSVRGRRFFADCFYHVLDHLESIGKIFFQQKLSPKPSTDFEFQDIWIKNNLCAKKGRIIVTYGKHFAPPLYNFLI